MSFNKQSSIQIKLICTNKDALNYKTFIFFSIGNQCDIEVVQPCSANILVVSINMLDRRMFYYPKNNFISRES